MILYVNTLDGDGDSYIINSYSDLRDLYDKYPRVMEIADSSFNLEAAVRSVAKYLSNHWMKAWVESGETANQIRLKTIGVDSDIKQVPDTFTGDGDMGFVGEVALWLDERARQKQALMPRRFVQRDPGRKHDDSKDRKRAATPTEELENSIDDANK